MQPFEFLIRSRPVSQQTRRRERLREWKEFVRHEAMRYWTSSHVPADGPVCITLVYLYDEVALDVDNILKPIQDALVGLVFSNDAIVTDAINRRRQLGDTFDLSRASPVLIEGFEYGDEFVYVHIADAPPQEQLLRIALRKKCIAARFRRLPTTTRLAATEYLSSLPLPNSHHSWRTFIQTSLLMGRKTLLS